MSLTRGRGASGLQWWVPVRADISVVYRPSHACVAALNDLADARMSVSGGKYNSAQPAMQTRIVDKVFRMCARLVGVAPVRAREALHEILK